MDGANEPVPQLHDIRRIPARYRDILPLEMMKLNRCAVVGAARGVLTVAIALPQDRAVVDKLMLYTGHAVFPVYVQPARLDLLLRRLERWERFKRKRCWRHVQRSPASLQAVGILLAYRLRCGL